MSSEQVVFRDLDISEQLRVVMAMENLTVAEMAAAAGVSKSAMEKYLAGPSSPRAAALASLCANLGLSMEWLLFGYSENDRTRVRDLSVRAFFQIMHDLKGLGPLSEKFNSLELGTREFNQFALSTAADRAEGLAEGLWAHRRKSMADAAAGNREAVAGISQDRFDALQKDEWQKNRRAPE